MLPALISSPHPGPAEFLGLPCWGLSWALLALSFTDRPLKHVIFTVYEDNVAQRIAFEAKNNQKSKGRQCHMGSAHQCAGILWCLVLF